MASNLLHLRRCAGFKSARDFAEDMGIPLSTYSRYEANPDKIPLAAAWGIADRLDCSIDSVVGRVDIEDEGPMRGAVQREYDALPEEGRALFDEFRDYVRYRVREKAIRRRSEELHRYDALCRLYERLLFQEREEAASFGDLMAFGTNAEQRRTFERFLNDRAAEKRKREKGDLRELLKRDEETIEHIMEAYDRIHGAGDIASEGEVHPGQALSFGSARAQRSGQ